MSPEISPDAGFGETVRQCREAKGISLRKFAKMLDLSPTFISKIERDETAAPSEVHVKEIAELLDLDPDLLLAKVGKVSSDLKNMILDQPQIMASFLRTVGNRSPQEIQKLTKELKENL
jgi:transcriptional regulator with XRE-family HTH domain